MRAKLIRLALVLVGGASSQDLFLASKQTDLDTCSFDADTDYQGGDYARVDVNSREECCEACTTDARCEIAVFFSGFCYLKDNALAVRIANAGRTSVTKGSSPTPPSPPPAPPSPAPVPPASAIEWQIRLGTNSTDPQILLNVGSGFAPFQLRGVDYLPSPPCCVNNDLATFQEGLYKRDLPRMAAMGMNAIKLYGMCDGVLDDSNYCKVGISGCPLQKVTVDDVKRFLDFAYSHRIFVLLCNRAEKGNVDAYAHLASTYGAHPAVAGAIIYDEFMDLTNFNAAAKAVHDGFAHALGKDPDATAVQDVGRIIMTATQGQAMDPSFQAKYGQYLNVWGWDPYARLDSRHGDKPIIITENGINGGYPGGCRNDCSTSDCTSCEDFGDSWKSYMTWLKTANLAGHFTFEWTSENWKGKSAKPCEETHSKSEGNFDEGNYGMFQVSDSGDLVAKNIGGSDTFESVFAAYGLAGAAHGGFRGWL